MNLILIRGGYPPLAVRPVDRAAYLQALQANQAGNGSGEFGGLLYQRLDATLEETLAARRNSLATAAPDDSPLPENHPE